MTNIFYIPFINIIGGIETYIYELAKKYGKYDITCIYNDGDAKQIARLRKYIRVIKAERGKIYECERLFVMYRCNLDIFKAKKIIQIIHADYEAQKLTPNEDPRIAEHYAVSKSVAEAYERISNIKNVGVCYNPLTIDKPKKVLKLISATRLTKEKGKDRMIKLAEMLDRAGIPYIWLVFTNDTYAIKNKNIVYMEPRLDIRDYIANADYLVQLSDTEAFSYSIWESLMLKTPVIITKIPSSIEMGVKDGINGYILDFDMNNVDVEKIYKKIPKFEFEMVQDIYDKLLVKKKSSYDPNKTQKVRVTRQYYDLELNQTMFKNTELELLEARAEYLKNELKVVEYV